jgi:hypothetical protein
MGLHVADGANGPEHHISVYLDLCRPAGLGPADPAS